MPEQNKKIISKYQGDKNPDERYLKLGRKITDAMGHKISGVTSDDPEYWGLREVLTPEMCDIANKMKLRQHYTFEQLLEEQDPAKLDLLQQLDILVDGPFRQEELSLELRFRGSANQRILNVPQSLSQGKAVWETRPRWVGDEVH